MWLTPSLSSEYSELHRALRLRAVDDDVGKAVDPTLPGEASPPKSGCSRVDPLLMNAM